MMESLMFQILFFGEARPFSEPRMRGTSFSVAGHLLGVADFQ